MRGQVDVAAQLLGMDLDVEPLRPAFDGTTGSCDRVRKCDVDVLAHLDHSLAREGPLQRRKAVGVERLVDGLHGATQRHPYVAQRHSSVSQIRQFLTDARRVADSGGHAHKSARRRPPRPPPQAQR